MFTLIAYDPDSGEYFGAHECVSLSDSRSQGRDWLRSLPQGICVEIHRNSLFLETVTDTEAAAVSAE